MQPEQRIFEAPVLVDGHVHLYPGFRVGEFFNGAVHHFERAARHLRIRPSAPPVLLLTETATDQAFRQLRDGLAPASATGWSFQSTGEDCSLLASCGPEKRVFVVAGRQIATREGLEVLAIGVDSEFPDGLRLRETLDLVRQHHAIPVIPWGFGKWWSRRGDLLRELLVSPAAKGIFLGDNGGRPQWLSVDPHCAIARSEGIWLLPGSDPLPFSWQTGKAGSYGFVLDGPVDARLPAESIKKLLRTQESQPRTFGRGEHTPIFLFHQVAMQLRKRGRELRGHLFPAAERAEPCVGGTAVGRVNHGG